MTTETSTENAESTGTGAAELLAPLDLAFWHLESTEHPMHLGALALFGGDEDSPDGEELLDLLAARAAAIPRLRLAVRNVWLPFGGSAWVTAQDFDVRRHVRRILLPADGFAAEATLLAGELMERPLARGLPPWEMYVLTADRGGECAVLVKLHHALADGMRAVAIGAGIFDQIAGARPVRARTTRPKVPASRFPGPGRAVGLARDRLGEVGQVLGIGASVVRAGRLHTLLPLPLPGGVPDALAAQSSGTRRLTTAALDLDDVHRVRRACGGTANDVLLAVVAGALRRWMGERGEPAGGDPRALVPVSRRRPGGGATTGNRLSAYLLSLPVTEPDPLVRLAAVRDGMARNKAAGPSRGAGAVALLADQLPAFASKLGAPLAGSAARALFDVLVTSVPLPRTALSLGGRPLRAVYPMAPLARGQSLAVALSTYGGKVHVGLVADAKAVPDGDRLAGCVAEALAELVRVVRG
ncbi:diacylglycerol O-acyltransferase [Streptomyces spiroverticillatus]|uniref:Diacylglycerol O-acyltransferase n=1 Tax=Streptomyces finlayi TaxID=67296 RepID=A0A918X361_9ACTN|nr:wax ester/triacylglycerol synthase family O-acyltransferase [Streptomyces finlayi]GHA26316.1 diacylglycerol O-acyltransferase [Streptomyces spiroverticillatus]GHD07856.1 diacylglycerol O-acyltransferase [Streptomyces finlayi]